jgi:hypothetical protein
MYDAVFVLVEENGTPVTPEELAFVHQGITKEVCV